MADYNTNPPLWRYFWNKVDLEGEKEEEHIRKLKLLASIGYKSAGFALKKHLGNADDLWEDEDEMTEMSTYDFNLSDREIDLKAPNDWADFADKAPLVYDWEVDEEGMVSVNYVERSPSVERSLADSNSLSSEEDDVIMLQDVGCLPFIYGGTEVENTEGWERLGLLPDPWSEQRQPLVSMITANDLKEKGINPKLDMVTLSSGLGYLSLTPDKEGYGYTKLQLSSKGIETIDLLRFYPYLQYVDLANNEIEDPTPLWEITQLVVLDLSNNKLTDSSIGKPNLICFLTYLNLSYNHFTRIPDFSNCWAIKHLDLAHNKIKEITVVNKLRYLSYLNLSNNELEAVENLDNKLIREVNFSYNRINCWQNPGPKAIHSLETIDVSNNKLPTLSIFAEMYNLTTLDVSYNEVSDMSEFDALKTLPVVTDLKIAGNQLNTIIPDPKRLIMYLVPSLKTLDGVSVSAMERVSAISLYGNNPLQQLICQNSRNFLYQHAMNPFVGWERPKETGEHPALVILIGDIGSSRTIIIDMVQKMGPHICKEVKMITSRPRTKIEVTNSRMKYVSLDKFNNIEKQGGFVAVERRLGHKYGIAVGELEDKHRVLLAFLGMTAALEFVWKGFNPALIIVLPNKEEILRDRCYYWFKVSDVYRSKFKVIKTDKGRNKRRGSAHKTESSGVSGDFDKELMFTVKKERKSPMMQRKIKARSKKCNRMFTSTYGKKEKRKLRHHSEVATDKKILDETYGGLLTTGPKGKLQMSWCNIKPKYKFKLNVSSDSLPYLDQKKYKRSRELSTISTAEENELRRFVQNIFRNQMNYRAMHIRNPGLFQQFISSDDLNNAAQAVFDIVKNLYEKLQASKKVKTVDMENDPNYESLVKQPIAELVDEVTKYDFPLDNVI